LEPISNAVAINSNHVITCCGMKSGKTK